MITRLSDAPRAPAPASEPEKKAMPAEAAQDAARKARPKKIQLTAKVSRLRDPYLDLWFEVGKPTDVHEITPWMNAQINARLLEVL